MNFTFVCMVQVQLKSDCCYFESQPAAYAMWP